MFSSLEISHNTSIRIRVHGVILSVMTLQGYQDQLYLIK